MIKHSSWPTVYVLVGVPGSGKSTWASAEAEARNAVIVSRDAIRAMLTGKSKKIAGNPDFEDLVTRIEDETVALAISAEKNVILDATNTFVERTTKRMDNVMRSVLYPHGPFPNVVVVKMDTPLEECLRRNADREDSVPEHIIHKMHKRLQSS